MTFKTRNLLLTGLVTALLNACGTPELETAIPVIGAEPAAADVAAFRSRIAADPGEVMPLLAGMPAPEFTILQADGGPYTFSAGPRDKPVIVTFYRGGWCPYCNRFLWKMREVEPALLGLGYDLIFISADRPEKLAAYLNEKDLSYTLLADNDLVAARAFGIAFRVSDDYLQKLIENDIDIDDASGRTHHALPVPATFVIGTDGIIDFQYVNPNYKVRVDPGVLIAAARAGLTESS